MAYKLPDSIKKQIHNKIVKKEVVDISKKAEELKKMMISEFNNHPVTIEIKAGPYAGNYSDTLVGVSGGNLFSFIGFRQGTDPIAPILQKLNSIKITSNTEYGNSFLNIIMPKIEDIWDITPMPWQEGRSWAKGIESGISGLNYYLFSDSGRLKNSRSGPAIQSEKSRSGARYLPTSYLSTLFKKYRTKFSSLYKRNKSIFTFVE
jgi:hypothetical protein